MYCDHWQLREPPFENVPDPRYVYLSAQHREAMLRLVYAVSGRKGACMLTGEVGCGKTTLGYLLRERLRHGNYQVALVSNPNLETDELLAEILEQLAIDLPVDAGRLERLRALRHRFQANLEAGLDTVVIIDEAHLIRHQETYEELRLLLNHHLDNRFLLTLVLAGQPELRPNILRIPQFAQRIPLRFHLQPLDLEDTRRYIRHRLERAGAREPIFTEAATDLLFEAAGGIPRRINTLCDMALLAGFSGCHRRVDAELVAQVVEEGV